jgi:preprotein translocase subunit SecD
MSSIRNRLIVILVLVLACAYGLFPRQVTLTSMVEGQLQERQETRIPLKLGLDLQGGMHLALEVDQSRGAVANPADALDRALTVIRTRIDEFGVAEPLVQKVGSERIVVELPGIDDPQRARDIVQRSAFLEFRITDMQDQFRAALPSIDAAVQRVGVSDEGAEEASGLLQILRSDTTQQQDDTTATADPTRPGAFSSLLFQSGSGITGEFLVPEEDFPRLDSLLSLPEVERAIPRGLDLLWGSDPLSQGARPFRGLYAVDNRPIITGEYLSDAQAQIDPVFNQAVVNFQLTRSGGRIFGRETGRHVGDFMAIVLDGRVQGQPPVIRSQIRRRGQIELGSASIQDAQDLALVLRAGALPAPITIVEERTVGPSLGRDSIDQGRRAGVIAALLVIAIIAVYYRLAGLFAIGALAFYVLFALGGLASLEATLTMPGLAGFVLSLGLAVDANVLIFERIREELALNKTPRLAIDSGFQHAMPAIIDANITTIITAVFLFYLGTGPVKGFAVTLIIGIIASLITAVFVTRTLFLIWLQRRSTVTELSI